MKICSNQELQIQTNFSKSRGTMQSVSANLQPIMTATEFYRIHKPSPSSSCQRTGEEVGLCLPSHHQEGINVSYFNLSFAPLRILKMRETEMLQKLLNTAKCFK